MSAAADDRDESVRLIRDSAAAIVPPGGDTRRIRALRFQPPGFDRAVWTRMCEMGWPGLLIGEADGGSALGMREYCALTEQLGAGLAPEPLIQASMAAGLLSGDALAAQLSGARLVLPAWQERANSLDAIGDTVIGANRVNGRKCFIPMAAGADGFLVSGQGGLALVAADAPGATLTVEQTQDGGNFGVLTLVDAPCAHIQGDFSTVFGPATLATAAYLLGVMDRVFAITLDYLKTRQQFGRPIGSFQVLQHRSVDMLVELEQARSMAMFATMMAGEADAKTRRRSISAAKVQIGRSGRHIGQEAVQLHGGIAMTMEYKVGHYFKRMTMLEQVFGDADTHQKIVSELGSLF
jgi:alkylation response protein AidB-like acyl-CoA dehydrogenase